jgi:hypothetical protein
MSVSGSDDSRPSDRSRDDESIGDVVEYVKAYAQQQTIEPIKGDRSATGSLSWLAYLITLALAVLLLVFTLSRIKKTTLNKEPK